MTEKTRAARNKTDRAGRCAELYKSEGMSPRVLRLFRSVIRGHYRKHGRAQPWRETWDPYHILVSEVMLQQTQVERVVDKYKGFIRRFPRFSSLAKAPLGSVLKEWQGLGYNRRAVQLHRCARKVAGEHGGRLPADIDALRSLPGIGPYTAGAVMAFAFGKPEAFIETNIRRVFIHFFFPAGSPVSDSDIMPLVEAAMDRRDPRTWYYALMDYGADLKKRVENPNRRSRHYARQSPFQGSRRQLRGRLLRCVLDSPGRTAGSLAGLCGIETSAAREILGDLAEEGFLVKEKGRYVTRET